MKPAPLKNGSRRVNARCRNWKRGRVSLPLSVTLTAQPPRNSTARSAGARERMIEKNQAREALQARLEQQEKSIADGRIVVLRLMGEISSIQNQLAQIEEYLAGIERETARAQKEEQSATVELDTAGRCPQGTFGSHERRQMELEMVSGERRRTEQGLGEQKSAAAELRAQIEAVRSDCSHLKARKEFARRHSFSSRLLHRVGQASFRRDGRGRRLPACSGVLADFVEVDPAYERAAEEFLHDELEYVVVEDWAQAEQGMELLRDGPKAAPPFWCTVERHSCLANADPRPATCRGSPIICASPTASPTRARPAAAPGELLPRSRSCRCAAAGRGESRFLFPAARRRSVTTATRSPAARRPPAARWQ